MKKKPPPGATLIARLKEQRLAREAELARKQSDAAAPAVTSEEPINNPVALAAKAKPVRKIEPQVEPAPESDDATIVAPATTVVISEDVTDQHIHAVDVRQHVAVTGNGHNMSRDLLHSEINIDDLRPTTGDYFVLTDEIKLAGRFAAVGLIAQGLRLFRLKDEAIYKDHYQTFEEYCRKEHQMSATYAYRLIRMAEMAERVAQLGSGALPENTDTMPDPFEVMLSLGHRHLMALLPLEAETAQELLIKGIPVAGEQEGGNAYVPISRATERQIRDALRGFAPVAPKVATRVVEKKSLASEQQLIPALSKFVEMLEDWALWLGDDAPPELLAARMGRGPLLNRLAKRFRNASDKIAGALEGGEEEK